MDLHGESPDSHVHLSFESAAGSGRMSHARQDGIKHSSCHRIVTGQEKALYPAARALLEIDELACTA